MRASLACILVGSVAASAAFGQAVMSVHSGVIHYVEGDVTAAGKPVDLKFGHFPELKPGETVKTGEGRAELLLTPGSFLRLAEGSEVRMISNQLSDTRFELVKGEALVESVDATKDRAAAEVKGNSIDVAVGESHTILTKAGLFVFTTDPARVRVYEGEAMLHLGSDELSLKKGREASLSGELVAAKFDTKDTDELYRWGDRRSGYLAAANISSAKTLNSTGAWSSYTTAGYGGWAFNPMFGMYTFVPMGGMAFSPFGYDYFSPYSVYSYWPSYYGYGSYYPGYGYGYGGGSSIGNYGSNSAKFARSSFLGSASSHSPVAAMHTGGAASMHGALGNAGNSMSAATSGFGGSSGGAARGMSSSSAGGVHSSGASAGGGGGHGGSHR